MNPSKDGGIRLGNFFMSNMKERRPSCLKHIDPWSRVVLSDGMRNNIPSCYIHIRISIQTNISWM